MGVRVDVEYCGKCNFKSQCLELVKAVKTMCPDAEVACKEGRRGSFEVQINDILVHSKLGSMAFPRYEDVAENVKNVSEGQIPNKCQEQPITDCVLQ